MFYKLNISRKAQKFLTTVSATDYQRIKENIANLAQNPRPPNCLKLKGREAWRIRVGDYRVIYEIADEIVTIIVVEIGHRREIYR